MSRRSYKVLVILPDPPWPWGDAAARWYHYLLSGLAKRGHQVTALAAYANEKLANESQALFAKSGVDLQLFPYARRGPVSSKVRTLIQPFGYMFSDELRASAAALQRRVDVIHLERLWSGWVGLPWRHRAVLNVHALQRLDLDGEGGASTFLAFGAEKRLIRSYPAFTTASARVLAAIKSLNAKATVDYLPLALDTSLYQFAANRSAAGTPVVTLIGSMDWRPTRLAAERLITDIWPKIRAAMPAARLVIVGRAAASALSAHRQVDGLSVEENVPDIAPYFRQASVLLYPVPQGSGVKIKVQEAMAFGLPVVTTPDGVDGLPTTADQVLVATSDEDLIAMTLQLLRDDHKRHLQAQAARRFIEDYSKSEAVLPRLEQVYAKLCLGGRGSP